MTEYEQAPIVAMYVDDEMSVVDIATNLSIPIYRVRAVLTSNNVTMRKPGPNTKEARKKYIKTRYGKDTEGNQFDGDWLKKQYFEEGKPITQIAKECGVSRQDISMRMYKTGAFVKGKSHGRNHIKKEVQIETDSPTCE